jgi:hypothetical protein
MAARQPRPQPPTKIAADFVRVHLGKGAFAPFTGTDYRAWNAFVYLLGLYGATRLPQAGVALRETYSCTLRGYGEQEDVAEAFRQTIAAVLDWSDVRVLWPMIAPDSKLPPQAIDHG